MARKLGRLHRPLGEASAKLDGFIKDVAELNNAAERLEHASALINQGLRSDPNVGIRAALGEDVGFGIVEQGRTQVGRRIATLWPQIEVFLDTTFDDAEAKALGKKLRPSAHLSPGSQTRHLLDELTALKSRLAFYEQPSTSSAALPNAATDRVEDVVMSKIRVFVSHSSDDEALASDLVDMLMGCFELKDEEVRCTSVPGHKLPVGTDATETIRDELSATSAIIGLLTPAAVGSGWVLFELGAAWGSKKRIFPLLAGGAGFGNLPGPLQGKHSVKVSDENGVTQLVDELAAAISATRRSAAKTQASIHRFVHKAGTAAKAGK